MGATTTTPNISRTRGIEKWIPGVRALRNYEQGWLPRDLVAAIVLSALLIPQGMAYAELAGLPPITGLYTTVVCLVAYAAFGPSPYLVLGPDSSLGPIIAAIILPIAMGDVDYAIALASMLAIFVGLLSLGAGIAKLGFIADLLSKPVRLGYMAGLAVTIIVGQLPKLFGYSGNGGDALGKFADFLANLGQTNMWALSMGVLALVVILGFKRWKPRVPGILIAVVLTIAISAMFDLASKGVVVAGVLPQGFPLPSFPKVELAEMPLLIGGAIGITLVAVGDTISISSGFAARRGIEVNSNQEIVGIGMANFFSGFFQGFPVSTSSSRTAVADQAGAKSQLTGLGAAALVLIMLLFAPGLVRNLPVSVLAAVIIIAGAGLFDYGALKRLYQNRKGEFLIAVVCFLGVAFIGVLEAIIIAVLLSILQIFVRVWRPHSAVLGKPKDVEGYHDLKRYPDASQTPGLLVLRWDAPLIFANANLFRNQVRNVIIDAEPTPRWVIVAAEPITDIDTTAADMLVNLDKEMNVNGIRLIFAELKDPVKDKVEQYGYTADRQYFYPTLEAALDAFRAEGGAVQG